MKTRKTLCLVFLVAAICLFWAADVFAENAVNAKLGAAQGNVLVKRGGGLQELGAFKGMLLSQGDWLRTEDNSLARLQYDNGTETTLGSYSIVMLEQQSTDGKNTRSAAKMWAGTVWSKVKNLLNVNDKYEIETPTAIMGVRGTLVLTTVDPVTGATKIFVLEGKVGVKANRDGVNEERILLAGEQLVIKPSDGNLPEKTPIDFVDLIKSAQPEQLLQIIIDAMARVDELDKASQTAANNFSQTKSEEELIDALILARKASDLAKLANELMGKVEQSDKGAQFTQVLGETGQSVAELKQKLGDQQADSQRIEAEIVRSAIAAGVSQSKIDSILAGALAEDTPIVEALAYSPSVSADNSSGSVVDNQDGTATVSLSIKDGLNHAMTGLTGSDIVVNTMYGSFSPDKLPSQFFGQVSLDTSNQVNGNFKLTFRPSQPLNQVITFDVKGVRLKTVLRLTTTESGTVNAAISNASSMDNGDGTAILSLSVKDTYGNGISDISLSDITLTTTLGSFRASELPQDIFGQVTIEISDQANGNYKLNFSPSQAIDQVIDIRVKGIIIKTGLRLKTADSGTIYLENCDATSSDNGDGTATITLTLKDAYGEGISGFTLEDITLTSAAANYQANAYYQAFAQVQEDYGQISFDNSDQANGIYRLSFSPNQTIDQSINISVKGIGIKNGLHLKTAEGGTIYPAKSNAEANANEDGTASVVLTVRDVYGKAMTGFDGDDIIFVTAFGEFTSSELPQNYFGQVSFDESEAEQGKYNFSVSPGKLLDQTVSIRIQGVTVIEDLRVFTTYSGTVNGRVKLADVENPVGYAGITVMAKGIGANGEDIEISTVTAEDGSFSLKHLPDGNLIIEASKEDYFPTSRVAKAAYGTTVTIETEFVLYAKANSGSLSGYAKFVGEDSFRGIGIRVETLEGKQLPDLIALTDDTGYFQFVAVPVDAVSGESTYILTAFALDNPAYATDSIQVTVKSGQAVTVADTLWLRPVTNGLIIFADDSTPWDSNVLDTLLPNLGVPYTIYPSNQMPSVALTIDKAVWIVNDQPQGFYNNYAANQAKFDEFVKNGGTLLFEACDQGWQRGSLATAGATLPGGVATSSYFDGINTNVNPTHPMMAGIDITLYGNSASHNYFANLPDSATILTRNRGGHPTLVEYKTGLGRVVATGQPLEHAWRYGYNLGQLYSNMVNYFFNRPTEAGLRAQFFSKNAGDNSVKSVLGKDVLRNEAIGPRKVSLITEVEDGYLPKRYVLVEPPRAENRFS